MTSPLKVRGPGSFVPEVAIAYGSENGPATQVDQGHPLPVIETTPASGVPSLAGTTSATGIAGPFVPQLGRAIWLSLSGSWTGSVQLLRSIDGGITRLPLTYADGSARAVWSGAVNAPVAEESVAGATYYLGVTMSSGTLVYRMEQ